MLCRAHTFAIDGLEPRPVTVEVDIRAGLPAFQVVGLADTAVREARERVHAAILNSGFEFPLKRITANLAPASLRKIGPGFDLALALGVLAASGQLSPEALARAAVFGELSLSGELRSCFGTLCAAEGASRQGLGLLVVPPTRVREAAVVEGLAVAGPASLREAARVIEHGPGPDAPPPADDAPADDGYEAASDLADVRGQVAPRRALEIAAAGGHSLLFEGPPGTGKTMLARRMPSILPPLRRAEALEVTRIASIAGLHDGGGLMTRRPFRAPHHTISPSGLVGGGTRPRPGEVTLAHRGVLFLDELSEFPRGNLEALRQPLEDGHVTIVRGQRTVIYPTCVMLVAATNPCPCGYAGAEPGRCRCGEADLARHRRRLSGPLLDRIDLLVAVDRPSAAELARDEAPECSARVRERVLAARERQAHRLRGARVEVNGEMDAATARATTRLADDAAALLNRAYDHGGLSARGLHRVVRVARTIADLAGSDAVRRDHAMRALALRRRDEPLELAA